MDSVAIVILNYMSWQNTLKMIEECNAQLGILYGDFVVIDNDSPNESQDKLSEISKEKGFVFIQSGRNGGYASGNNIGLRYAYEHGYKYAWILNNDIEFDSQSMLKSLIDVLMRDNSIGVINPEIITEDGRVYNRDSVRYSFFDLTLGMLAYRKKGRRIKDLGGYAYVYRPQGCCMLLDLSKLAEIDFLDEHTFLYCEEMILAERLMEYGYRCALCTTEKVVHRNSETVKKALDHKKYVNTFNDSFVYYLTKYRGYGRMKASVCRFFNTIKLNLL